MAFFQNHVPYSLEISLRLLRIRDCPHGDVIHSTYVSWKRFCQLPDRSSFGQGGGKSGRIVATSVWQSGSAREQGRAARKSGAVQLVARVAGVVSLQEVMVIDAT